MGALALSGGKRGMFSTDEPDQFDGADAQTPGRQHHGSAVVSKFTPLLSACQFSSLALALLKTSRTGYGLA